MIVQCPECRSRYRFDDARIGNKPIRLKCKHCEAPFTVDPSPPASPLLKPRTALLADEPREFRDFVFSALQKSGFEVSITDNGEEALLLAGSHRFDLIILNAYLRKVLGITVCERVKKTPELRTIPILLIGSVFESEAPATSPGRSYGADDFINPGITREDLSARIARLLSGSPVPAPEVPAPSSADEAEIRRLARIMISDLEIYHPQKFSRALSEGSFVRSFAAELGHGRAMIESRFGHIPERFKLLAEGLRDALEKRKGSTGSSGTSRA
ncbi:MAG TPA: response regulator [Candidatus Polarisedimenticolia bacterium]|nr:response regulator [Candidatus Polarisedimenticolia bacterium]